MSRVPVIFVTPNEFTAGAVALASLEPLSVFSRVPVRMDGNRTAIAHFDPPAAAGGVGAAPTFASVEMDAECYYVGTDFLEVKIVLIGIFAALLAVTSFFFNAFFTCVFILSGQLRKSPLYYFGVLAVLDTIMAVNYLALMAVPVYMDHFGWLWLYLIFLTYLKPMLTLSNCAIFASVLMILLATVERLLLTSQSEKLSTLRKFLARRRPKVCLFLILLAAMYKTCTYFEIDYIENENCEDWTRYEIIPTELSRNQTYNFWWMFVARNLVDRIIPFFVLVFTNIIIIRTLKREHRRLTADTPIAPRRRSLARLQQPRRSSREDKQPPRADAEEMYEDLLKSNGHKMVRYAADSVSASGPMAGPVAAVYTRSKSNGSTGSLTQSIRRKGRKASSRVRRALSRRGSQEDSANKRNLRDATRALLAVVTMYLMSQTLQVLITFWEAFWKVTLENEYKHFYSFINDIMSILPLLSSALRFPVYCAISKPISKASRETLCRLFATTGVSESCDDKSAVVRPIVRRLSDISPALQKDACNGTGPVESKRPLEDKDNSTESVSIATIRIGPSNENSVGMRRTVPDWPARARAASHDTTLTLATPETSAVSSAAVRSEDVFSFVHTSRDYGHDGSGVVL